MVGAMIRLRPLTEEDLPALHRWYQDPALWAHLVGAFVPRAEAEAIAYMRGWLTASASALRLGVEANGELIGQVALAPIADGEAEFHIFLGDALERGKGYGAEATRLMLARAFGELGLGRVTLEVLATNAAARRVYDRLGFVAHGVVGRVAKDGDLTDVVGMSIDAARFAEGQPRPAIT